MLHLVLGWVGLDSPSWSCPGRRLGTGKLTGLWADLGPYPNVDREKHMGKRQKKKSLLLHLGQKEIDSKDRVYFSSG